MSRAEKLALMKVLADTLTENSAPKRRRTLKNMYGALHPKTGRLPSNKQIKKDYANFLVEKYK